MGIMAALIGAMQAQEVPLQRPEERAVTQQQSQELFDVIRPVARRASASTVQVWANRRWMATGTVIGDGSQVLTKWSEIALSQTVVQVVGAGGQTATATVLGVYQDEDLALLQIEGARFNPIEWSAEPSPAVGHFLVAAGPDDRPFGLGVVAVAERSLRETDQAFIGVRLDDTHQGEGVRILSVDERGGADEAGIQAGDVILALGDKQIASAFELRNALLEYKPGDQLTVKLARRGKALEVVVDLGGRPEFPGIPEGRLKTMRQMGGATSLVASNFPVVIQTDMQLRPNECGGPIVDLHGQVVGLSIARADRTRSFIIPSAEIVALLGRKPLGEALAQLDDPGQRPPRAVPVPGAPRRDEKIPKAVPMRPRAASQLRNHLEEMAGVLEQLDSEMEKIGE